MIPATSIARRSGFAALREGGRGGSGGRQRVRAALVSVEVAMSVVLLVSSAFFIRALRWLLVVVALAVSAFVFSLARP